MKTFELTPVIRTLHTRVNVLNEHLPTILRPSRLWEYRVTVADRVEYLYALADARARLFTAVNAEYPELTRLGYTVSENGIQCESLESPEAADAVDPHAEVLERGPRA